MVRILKNISLFVFSSVPITGFTQGVTPIISYNFGAKNIGRLKEAGLYNDYLKEINVKGHVAFRIDNDEDGSKMATLTTPEKFKLDFSSSDIITDEDGNATLSENGNKIISQLRELDLSTKELAKKHKELRDELSEVLNEEGIENLHFGGSSWESIPEGTSARVDVSRLKEDNIYDDYVRMVQVDPSLTARWSK